MGGGASHPGKQTAVAELAPVAGVRTRKGVSYDASGGLVECLFCKISAREAPNPLWYRDQLVSVFVPRQPAAALHFLVIPNQHVGDLNTLTAEHVPLLLHMRNVALAQLRSHAAHFDLTSRKLTRLAPPPVYDFPRGLSQVAGDGADTGPTEVEVSELAGLDPSRLLLAFHRPPFNSIEHLHLHAIYRPYVNAREAVHFVRGSPWVATWEAVVQRLRSGHHMREKL
jgi:hypothetical protein